MLDLTLLQINEARGFWGRVADVVEIPSRLAPGM